MPSTGRLSPDRTALVVVDFQEKLTPAVVDHGRVVKNALLLLRLARTLDLPVVLTTQYAKGLGPTIPEVEEAAGVAALDKLTFGCFGDPAFTERLRALGPRTARSASPGWNARARSSRAPRWWSTSSWAGATPPRSKRCCRT
jgi:hypothetical protein